MKNGFLERSTYPSQIVQHIIIIILLLKCVNVSYAMQLQPIGLNTVSLNLESLGDACLLGLREWNSFLTNYAVYLNVYLAV